jgi:hypothetical protein
MTSAARPVAEKGGSYGGGEGEVCVASKYATIATAVMVVPYWVTGGIAMKFFILSIFSLGLLAICGAPATAAPITGMVVSTFDSDLDGWTHIGGNNLSFSSTIGNPAGSALFTDGSGGGTGTLVAPANFRGDWSLVNNLQYQHKIIDPGGGPTISNVFHVTISGPGGTASFGTDPNTVQPSTDQWVDIVAPVEESAWNVTSGSWANILNDVTSLQIQIEMVANSNPSTEPRDQDAIDNVMLNVGSTVVPEPTSVLLVSSAVIGVLGLRRRVGIH